MFTGRDRHREFDHGEEANGSQQTIGANAEKLCAARERITMSQTLSTVLAVALLSLTVCGHYPAPIRSARDINRTSSSENMVVLVRLPLADWPKLQKFAGLEHFSIAEEAAATITDNHIEALSRLKMPKLRQVSLAYCSNITDRSLLALTNLESIQGLHLVGTRITDTRMQALATDFPNLRGINVEECQLLTVNGFLGLTNSKTITSVSLSFDPFSQGQIETVFSTISNVIWWTISDPLHRLDLANLRQLGESRRTTIQVVDENKLVTGITTALTKRGGE